MPTNLSWNDTSKRNDRRDDRHKDPVWCNISDIESCRHISKKEPKKSKRCTWIKYEREHSNSLWHTDWKQLDNGEWVICYQDDASRFVTGHGVFEHATTENSLLVLEEAIEKHGKPEAILSDRGVQFYANASKNKKGISKFEKRLAEIEIKHIVARPRHPQTNGKIERLFGELQRKLPCFEEIMQRTRDPVDLFIENYNYEPASHVTKRWRRDAS